MMRTSKFRQFLALSLLVLSAAAGAQTPSSAPPKLEKLDESADAPITVTPKSGERSVTEKREQGKVTEVKVTSGKSTYYLKPNTPAGSAVPGDLAGSANRGPQWKVLEFDLGKKTKDAKEQEAADNAPAPPIAK